jgi:hypothetical protein
MSGQPGKNIQVIYKVEPVPGTPVTGGGGEMFRIHAGQGLKMDRALIEDPEVRKDGQRSMARLGTKSVTGTYSGTLSVGTFNTLLAALFRNTFVATAVKFTCDGGAAHTSLATTLGNTLTLAGTDNFITTHGIRVGDVIRLGAMGAGVDNVNGIVATIAANVITVLGTPWTNITADSNATFTVMKKLTNGATLTRSAYTFEQYYEDLDEAEQFTLGRVSSLRLTWQPNAVVKVEFGIVGQSMAILGTAAAPGLTSPTEYVSVGLIAVDALISIAGAAIATITGGELMFDLAAQGIAVVGSTLSPDIYEGAMKVTGQITAVRTALTGSHLARYLAETDNVELSLLFVEPDAAVPIDFIHFFIPRLKYLGVVGSLGDDGPIPETIPIYAAAKATTTGYDSATATISTSA